MVRSVSLMSLWLENQLQCQLHRARAPDLVERTEPGKLALQTRRERRGRLPEPSRRWNAPNAWQRSGLIHKPLFRGNFSIFAD
jgi:hypothetical protein